MNERDAKTKWLDELAPLLQDGWRRYREGFGEDPHGTLPQIKAMLELTKMPPDPRLHVFQPLNGRSDSPWCNVCGKKADDRIHKAVGA